MTRDEGHFSRYQSEQATRCLEQNRSHLVSGSAGAKCDCGEHAMADNERRPLFSLSIVQHPYVLQNFRSLPLTMGSFTCIEIPHDLSRTSADSNDDSD